MEDHSRYTLCLLNSPESLEIIDELWDLPNDDINLSVRCAAALVAAFVITPPCRVLDMVALLYIVFIGNDNTGKQFLVNRLCVGPTVDGCVGPEIHPNSDTARLKARLKNIARFLEDIQYLLPYVVSEWWLSDNLNSFCQERQALSESHYMEVYHNGFGLFGRKGDRASPTFIPAGCAARPCNTHSRGPGTWTCYEHCDVTKVHIHARGR